MNHGKLRRAGGRGESLIVQLAHCSANEVIWGNKFIGKSLVLTRLWRRLVVCIRGEGLGEGVESESMSWSAKYSLTIDFPTRWVSINNKHTHRAKPFSNPIFTLYNYLIFHFHESAAQEGEFVAEFSTHPHTPLRINSVASNYGTSKLINSASFTVCHLALLKISPFSLKQQ